MPSVFSPAYSNPGASRRTFLKTTALLSLSAIGGFPSLAAVLEGKGAIALVAAPDDALANAVPPQWALGELKAVLAGQGATVRVATSLAKAKPEEFCVVVGAMNSPVVKKVFARKNISAPTEVEALVLVQTEIEGVPALLAAGTDDRGLVYALTELADRVFCLQTSRAALEFSEPVIERPASRIRSLMRGFNSEVEDKAWFYDQDYWREYLTMLVTSRVNRLSFTMGMGYNSVQGVTDGYLVFPYPFFVAVPGHDVRAKGLPDQERGRNLAMLKFIGEECARRGLLFQLGIWTLAYTWERSPKATYAIEGLTDATHAPYCRDALALLLREVPQITGVTFRVHYESGIPKGQEDFWQVQFSAIKDCGRRVEIDMHAKDMTPETLQTALTTGQPVCVSPKYCGEHLSLPYHQASIREMEMSPAGSLEDTGTGVLAGNRKFTRYGYADSFAENRNWDVVFRIWPGTQRFLLSGDPATFAGYGRQASFCGAAGIDLSEPLHFKGRRGSGLSGGRLAYADASLNPRYDFEKFRYTYRLWGRLCYNPDTDPEVWRRVLRQEFGAAALAIEQSLAAVTRVLPLFTVAHGISGNCTRYWPEIYSNLPMENAREASGWDMGPPLLFGNVGGLDAQLFMSAFDCGDALLAGRAMEKYTPLEVARWQEGIAVAAVANLTRARTLLGGKAREPAFRRIEEDVLILEGLARFFAGKLRSAVLWRIHTATGSRAAGEAAIARYTEARNVWASMAERARGVYRTNITYGGGRTGGHWSDRLAAFDADVADMQQRLAAGDKPPAKYDNAAVERALKMASAEPVRPVVAVQHAPARKFQAGQALSISASVASPAPRRVTLRYRHVNQAECWESVELKRNGNVFAGEIPADYTSKRWPLQYYFEVETSPTEAMLFPPLAEDLANEPYFVARRTA